MGNHGVTTRRDLSWVGCVPLVILSFLPPRFFPSPEVRLDSILRRERGSPLVGAT